MKRDAAPGVDGVTWETYENDLDRRIEDLHARVKRGAYRALPSRRSYIPKEDGSKRPLAVAALEDKIVQRATAAVLSEIFEEDFLGFSYGFRPKRSQHDALDALIVGISTKNARSVTSGPLGNGDPLRVPVASPQLCEERPVEITKCAVIRCKVNVRAGLPIRQGRPASRASNVFVIRKTLGQEAPPTPRC
jgi:hypothetical protein